jgi:hypothetical protein
MNKKILNILALALSIGSVGSMQAGKGEHLGCALAGLLVLKTPIIEEKIDKGEYRQLARVLAIPTGIFLVSKAPSLNIAAKYSLIISTGIIGAHKVNALMATTDLNRSRSIWHQ